MDDCFLSSNTFSGTTPFILSIKANFSTYPKRNHNLFQCKKVKIPSLITCCHPGSSSPEDDSKSNLDPDWRSFRARLVAGERAPRSEAGDDLSSRVDPHTADLDLDDKWAHTIHEPEKGCLLIATDKLDGDHTFKRTVILLLSTGPVGPAGIILNRTSLMSVKETKSTVFDVSGTFSDRPLFFGGPLEEGLFLVRPRKGGDDGVGRIGVFDEVMKGLYYGTKERLGCAAQMVNRNSVRVDEFMFFDGYCGWGNEQLRDEIRAGYWTVSACSLSVLGLSTVGIVGLWDQVLGLLGRKKVW